MSNKLYPKLPTNDDTSDDETYENASATVPKVDTTTTTTTNTTNNSNNSRVSYPNIDDLIDKQSDLSINNNDDETTEINECDGAKDKNELDEESKKDYEKTLTDEQLLVNKNEANKLKNKGNDEYKLEEYTKSIETYTDGLKLCPFKFTEDRAILYGNRGAAHIQLNNKTLAIEDCTKAIELNSKYVKVLIRRAKLYEDTDKLDESLEDYKKILELDSGCSEARLATVRLPPKIDERNEKLKTEMLGKLKDLGNIILKPFGLSTNNFQMKQDPSTGSYSVNFNQNAGK